MRAHTHTHTHPPVFPPSPIASTRRPFVCIFKLNRLYAAIREFYAASSCPHYRVKPVREIQSATISRRRAKFPRVGTAVESRGKGGYYSICGGRRRVRVLRVAHPYLRRKGRGEGTKRENYRVVWIRGNPWNRGAIPLETRGNES